MVRPLSAIVQDFRAAFLAVDASKPQGRSVGPVPRVYQPGIGPLSEAQTIKLALGELRKSDAYYAEAAPRRYPGTNSSCDLVVAPEWSIEFKQVRPFGDNGREAEQWSQNLLHPYPGHVSALGDAMKLKKSSLTEKKAIVVFGYEHSPAQILLEPAVRGFEILASQLIDVPLSPRVEASFGPLIHPVHQVGRIYAWEVV